MWFQDVQSGFPSVSEGVRVTSCLVLAEASKRRGSARHLTALRVGEFEVATSGGIWVAIRAHEIGFVRGMAYGAIDKDSRSARFAAYAKLANDPKQKDKATVRECWEAWQKRPDNYGSKAAFARDMREKFPNLESQPVIEGWCRTWERESKPSVC